MSRFEIFVIKALILIIRGFFSRTEYNESVCKLGEELLKQ
jgi:hypothetical protein